MRDVRVDLRFTNPNEKIQNPRRRSVDQHKPQTLRDVDSIFVGFSNFALVQALEWV